MHPSVLLQPFDSLSDHRFDFSQLIFNLHYVNCLLRFALGELLVLKYLLCFMSFSIIIFDFFIFASLLLFVFGFTTLAYLPLLELCLCEMGHP